jgi:hypothetical protein
MSTGENGRALFFDGVPYSADDMVSYLGNITSDGVLMVSPDSLEVTTLTTGGVVTQVAPGIAYLNGYCYKLGESGLTLTHEEQSSGTRIDYVALVLNTVEKTFDARVIKGPSQPALNDLKLARVTIDSTGITDVEDMRQPSYYKIRPQENLDNYFRTQLRTMMSISERINGINAWSNKGSFWFDSSPSGNEVSVSGGSVKMSDPYYLPIDTVTGCAYSGSGDNAAYAFDSNSSTYSYLTYNENIQIEFPDTPTVYRIYINCGFGPGSSYPSISVRGSNNGSDWKSITSRYFNNDSSFTYTSSSALQYKYYRFEYTSGEVRASLSITFYKKIVVTKGIALWFPRISDGMLSKALVESNHTTGSGTIQYSISRDGGTTFTQCDVGEFTPIGSQPSGTSIVLKAEITGDAQINGVAWGGMV